MAPNRSKSGAEKATPWRWGQTFTSPGKNTFIVQFHLQGPWNMTSYVPGNPVNSTPPISDRYPKKLAIVYFETTIIFPQDIPSREEGWTISWEMNWSVFVFPVLGVGTQSPKGHHNIFPQKNLIERMNAPIWYLNFVQLAGCKNLPNTQSKIIIFKTPPQFFSNF